MVDNLSSDMRFETSSETVVSVFSSRSHQKFRTIWMKFRTIVICIVALLIFSLLVPCVVMFIQTRNHVENSQEDVKKISEQVEKIQEKSERLKIEGPITHIRKQILLLSGWYHASNDFWYKLFREKVNYYDAKLRCNKTGARLATVSMRNSMLRSEIIKAVVEPGKQFTWIGLDSMDDDTWTWLDGVESNINNTDWLPGEPNDSGWSEDCAMLFYYWRVNDSSCYEDHYFLCEKEHEW